MNFPLPRSVAEGSHLAIVAPSGPFDPEAFEAGIEWLRQRYEVSYRADIYSRHGYLAGDDRRRLKELRWAISDPDVDAIVCARGGFGATRLLPGLSVTEVKQANKLIVGFSDITALHALWARAGVRSIHGPMVAGLATAPDPIRRQWVSTLENPGKSQSWELTQVNQPRITRTEGRLIGGNLAVLTAMLGTPHLPSLDHAVLFIEDVGERPYRVDRMLTTFRQARGLDRLAGILLGSFTESEPGPDGVTMEEVFRSHFALAPFPVLAGLSAGHVEDNQPLPLGAKVAIRDHHVFVLKEDTEV